MNESRWTVCFVKRFTKFIRSNKKEWNFYYFYKLPRYRVVNYKLSNFLFETIAKKILTSQLRRNLNKLSTNFRNYPSGKLSPQTREREREKRRSSRILTRAIIHQGGGESFRFSSRGESWISGEGAALEIMASRGKRSSRIARWLPCSRSRNHEGPRI